MSGGILSLDVATNTGFAHDAGPSGVWCFDERTRLKRFYECLEGMDDEHGVSRVVFESAVAYARHGGFAVEMEMHGVMKLWCVQRSIKCIGVSPTKLKRWATGDGKAKKDQMVAAARRMFPDRAITGDDEADALMLLLYAQKEIPA